MNQFEAMINQGGSQTFGTGTANGTLTGIQQLKTQPQTTADGLRLMQIAQKSSGGGFFSVAPQFNAMTQLRGVGLDTASEQGASIFEPRTGTNFGANHADE